jgi:hypothetical protein
MIRSVRTILSAIATPATDFLEIVVWAFYYRRRGITFARYLRYGLPPS